MEFKEFRVLLLYLRQYLELWVMFDRIDTSQDRRIEESEFSAAVCSYACNNFLFVFFLFVLSLYVLFCCSSLC